MSPVTNSAAKFFEGGGYVRFARARSNEGRVLRRAVQKSLPSPGKEEPSGIYMMRRVQEIGAQRYASDYLFVAFDATGHARGAALTRQKDDVVTIERMGVLVRGQGTGSALMLACAMAFAPLYASINWAPIPSSATFFKNIGEIKVQPEQLDGWPVSLVQRIASEAKRKMFPIRAQPTVEASIAQIL